MDTLAFLDEVLGLIEGTAPVQEFSSARDALVHADGNADSRALLEQVYQRAVHVRDVLAEHRSREHELGILIDMAADLTSMHDLEEVLHALCQRVRSLLGTDAAWITLVDPQRGGTYHAMTDGMVSADLVTAIRLSAGTGLGGLVLQTGSAEWTDDYLADQRFRHTHQIDHSAITEGLMAMVGAPMKCGEKLLGIVITGNRGPRRFTVKDVRLLQTLADHAAISISNARLLASAATASAELREAGRVIQLNAEIIEQSAKLHARMSRLALDGKDLRELLAPVAEALGGRVTVLDAEHRILAVEGAALDEADHRFARVGAVVALDPLPAALSRALRNVSEGASAVMVQAVDGRAARLLAPMLARSEPLGTLILTKAAPGEADLGLVEAAALPLAMFLANAHAQARVERMVRGELLEDLLRDATNDPAGLRRRAQQIAWDPDRPYTVSILSFAASPTRWTRLRLNRLVAGLGGLVTEREHTVVLLLPAGSPDGIAAELSDAVQAGGAGPPTVAVSRVATRIEHVPLAYEEARRALALTLALGRPGTTVLADKADAFGIVFGSAEPHQLEQFIDRTLGPLLTPDGERGSELLPTLEAWFAHDGHMANTSKASYIHVNTLYKRMERIDELLGENWRDTDRRLQIQLALRLRRLAAELQAAGRS